MTSCQPARKTNQEALDRFIAHKAKIDELLTRLQGLSADHFNQDPEKVNWCHVGDLAQIEEWLQYAVDFAFNEGECSETE